MLITELLTDEKVLAIIGLAKNTGKTVCLNQLVSELHLRKKRLGITSIGRDGERVDAINGAISKPPIYVVPGCLVSSTIPFFEKSNLEYRVLYKTGFRTSVGIIVVAEMGESGAVEVAGPATIATMRHVCEFMMGQGVDLTLIDGALNRKATASPELSDGIIVSTGAVLSPDMDEVLSVTKGQIEMLTIRAADEARLSAIDPAERRRVVGLDENGRVVEVDCDPLSADDEFWCNVVPGLSHLVFRHALVEATVERILRAAKGRPMVLVVKDSAKLFLSAPRWRWFEGQGLAIRVWKPTKLIALTVNPVAPEAHQFSPDEFLARVKETVAMEEVFNVCSPGYQQRAAAIGSALG